MTSDNQTNSREAEIQLIQEAARETVRNALRRHMLLGESVAVADEHGNAMILGPDEIWIILSAA